MMEKNTQDPLNCQLVSPNMGSIHGMAAAAPIRLQLGKKPQLKVRSGCLTCRRRKIKCDEMKPACRHCIVAKRHCEGILYEGAIHPSTTALHARKTVSQRNQNLPRSVYITNYMGWEIAPSGWEAIEAYECYNVIISPQDNQFLMDTERAVALNEPPRAPHFVRASVDAANSTLIVAFVIGMKISALSYRQDIDLVPGVSIGNKRMWTSFFNAMHASVLAINSDILEIHASTSNAKELRNRVLEKRTLQRIANLMAIERFINSPTFQAHIEGFFGLLNSIGKFGSDMTSSGNLGLALQTIILESVIANAVSSPHNNVKSIYLLSDHDLLTIYKHAPVFTFPCPSVLFAEVLAINRLRRDERVFQSVSTQLRLERGFEILERINKFDPDSWTEDFALPSDPEAFMIAKAYKLTAELYCILALQLEESPESYSAYMTYRQESKLSLCMQIVSLIRIYGWTELCNILFTWPAAVAGVVLATGSQADRNLIAHYLDTFFQDDGKRGLVRTGRKKLLSFWKTSRTQWDDCWDELFLLV